MKNQIQKSALLLVAFLVALAASAQKKIVLCTDYDKVSGTPSGVYSSWDLKGEKSYIYIHYDNGGTPISGTAYIYIDYIWSPGEDYKAYETVEVTSDAKGKTWFVYDMGWKDPGKYRIEMKINGVTQASTYATLNADPSAGSTSSDDGEVDTYYYENSEILFGTGLDSNNELVGEATEFSLGSSGSREVTVYVSMDNPFKTGLVYVELYDANENKKVDEYSLEITPEWDWLKFKHEFTKPGSYYFDIYNEDDIFINTASVTITR